MLSSKYYNDDSLISSDDSEDYHEIFYSSSSHDRSSIGSIPWAEDAIKQNQQEWERVERMFYGEENLPENDEDLRNEIIEWNNAFPHLRIVGKKVNINSTSVTKSSIAAQSTNKLNNISCDEDDDEETIKEEIIAIHPLPGHGVNRAFINTFHTNFINDYSSIENTTSAKSFQHRKSNSDGLLSSILEKDLRISSVPMIRRRSDRAVKAFAILPPTGGSRIFSSQTKISIPNEKKSIIKFADSSRNNFYSNSHNIPSAKSSIIPIRRHQKNSGVTSTMAASMKSVSSASSFLRMPPILNIILPSSSSHHNEFNSILRKRNREQGRTDENYSISEIGTTSGGSNSSVRNEKRRIILPAINQFHNEIKHRSETVATRSVSAAVI